MTLLQNPRLSRGSRLLIGGIPLGCLLVLFLQSSSLPAALTSDGVAMTMRTMRGTTGIGGSGVQVVAASPQYAQSDLDVVSAQAAGKDWHEYIKSFARFIKEEFKGAPVRVLDHGGPPEGWQACLFSALLPPGSSVWVHNVRGPRAPMKPFPTFVQCIPPNSGQSIADEDSNLPFVDGYFDVVVSLFVYESATIRPYTRESVRVLKPQGVFLIVAGPLWSSCRGHHLQDAMFSHTPYRNDGSFVPDWGHLIMTKEEMKKHLVAKGLRPASAEAMVTYSYESNQLNRVSFDHIYAELKSHRELDLALLRCSSAAEPTCALTPPRVQQLFPQTNSHSYCGFPEVFLRKT